MTVSCLSHCAFARRDGGGDIVVHFVAGGAGADSGIAYMAG